MLDEHRVGCLSTHGIAALTTFKAILLKGLEVVFIVIALGVGRGMLVECCPRPTTSPKSRARKQWLARSLARNNRLFRAYPAASGPPGGQAISIRPAISFLTLLFNISRQILKPPFRF
jgi:hypothetical protein